MTAEWTDSPLVMLSEYLVGPIAVSWANAMLGEVTPKMAEAVSSSPNAMLGEVTPKMAEAVSSSPAFKFFLPLSQENAEIVGVTKEPLPHLVQAVVERIKEKINNV